MRNLLDVSHLIAAIIYSVLGVAVFWTSFVILDKLTPYDLWQEIVQKQNRALATVVGCISLGICIIVAAAMIG